MGSTANASPRQSFAADYLTWIALRHFLPLPMLRELLDLTVSAVSTGRLGLKDLFIDVMTDGEPAFQTWAVRPKALGDDRVGRHLQQVIRAIVWHGDAQYPIDHTWPADDIASVKGLSEAVAVSRMDLLSLSPSFEIEANTTRLRGLLTCMVSGRTLVDDNTEYTLTSVIDEHFPGTALGCVVHKHLGDLFVDAERWEAAKESYVAAAQKLGALGEDWSGLTTTLTPAISQSLAAVQRAAHGPFEASTTLQGLELAAERELDWVTLSNVPHDLFEALHASRNFGAMDDRMVGVLAAPNLAWGQNLAHALETWQDGRYEDAFRWFWSVLRRQIALGTASSAKFTKGLYGRCLIDGTNDTFESQRQVDHLALGVRMLIESGSVSNARRTDWVQRIVDSYIDEPMLQSAVDAAHSAPGHMSARKSVLLVLLAKWCEKLSPEKTDLSVAMIRLCCDYATDEQSGDVLPGNVVADAFKALHAIALSRPELRSLAGQSVMTACLKGVLNGSPIAAREAMKVAFEYSGALEPELLMPFTTALLEIVDQAAPSAPDLIVSTTALAFLQRAYFQLSSEAHKDLRGRVADALLSLSASGSAQAAFIPLLQDMEPEDAERLSDPLKLEEVVATLEATATAINRSDAANAMSALLEAPDIVGKKVIVSALEGLHRALADTVEGRTPAAFTDAYAPLLSLVRHKSAVETLLEGSTISIQSYFQTLFVQLVSLWQKSRQDHSMFLAFAIPLPEVPNRTVVHNWSFASLAFARSLGLGEEMRTALAEAAHNPLLRETILVATVVEAPADVVDFGPSQPFPETTREAYYAALGRRLAAISGMARADRPGYVGKLLEQCFRFGPRGEDAAVMVMALDLNLPEPSMPAVRDYGRRLDNDRSLRLALGPLLSGLRGGSGAKEE